jgi:hypothetical protein
MISRIEINPHWIFYFFNIFFSHKRNLFVSKTNKGEALVPISIFWSWSIGWIGFYYQWTHLFDMNKNHLLKKAPNVFFSPFFLFSKNLQKNKLKTKLKIPQNSQDSTPKNFTITMKCFVGCHTRVNKNHNVHQRLAWPL